LLLSKKAGSSTIAGTSMVWCLLALERYRCSEPCGVASKLLQLLQTNIVCLLLLVSHDCWIKQLQPNRIEFEQIHRTSFFRCAFNQLLTSALRKDIWVSQIRHNIFWVDLVALCQLFVTVLR